MGTCSSAIMGLIVNELKIKFYRVSKLDQFCRLRKLCSKTFRSSVDLILDIMVDFIKDLDSIKRCDNILISIKRDNLENLIKKLNNMNSKMDHEHQHYDDIQKLLDKLNIVNSIDWESYYVVMCIDYLDA